MNYFYYFCIEFQGKEKKDMTKQWNTQKIVTTKEQAEKLLAIGIPADSADFYYTNHTDTDYLKYNNIPHFADKGTWNLKSGFIPCWSPTRLVDIIKTYYEGTPLDTNNLLSLIDWNNMVDWLVDTIITLTKHKSLKIY